MGSVGEPIAAEVWHWYNDNIGRGQAHIVDTYWQTESGSHLLTPLAGITPTKPGSASLPFFGVDPKILDPTTGEELPDNDVEGFLPLNQLGHQLLEVFTMITIDLLILIWHHTPIIISPVMVLLEIEMVLLDFG